MCVFFSTEKWSIKYGSYCIVATAQMKFASEARPSQYIGPWHIITIGQIPKLIYDVHT